jgi:hypothetical protein
LLKDLLRTSSKALSALTPRGRPDAARKERLFCSQPFTRYEILGGGQRGEVFSCCQSWITRSFGNMSDQPVAKVWNSKDAQAIRRSILDGSFRYCRDVCPYLQQRDGPVQRVDEVDDPRMREVIDKKLTVLPFSPSDIICCFDQSCNLSCPTCRKAVIMETAHGDAIIDIQKRLEGEALKDAKLLYITGSGDPFGSPFFRRWLQTFDRAAMPNLERIHLHTNALLWTPRIWATISPEIRALIRSATLSIDAATDETYAANRRGGDFATLLKRLAFIAELRRDGPLDYLEIHMTVQANNFREMPAFVELGRKFRCDRVAFHQLLDWGSFTPKEFAARAVQRPDHPEHEPFLDMLADPRLEDELAYLSNLLDLKQAALAWRSAAVVEAAV